MKILKYLLFLFLIIFIAGSIYIATKEGDYQVEHSETIFAPKELVYNQVNDYTNWENWEPWSEESEDMIRTYNEKTSGEGAGYSWKSDDMGNGRISTTSTKPFSAISQKITFETQYGDSSSDVYWDFEEVENGTKVTWGMKGDQSFMEKLAFSFQDESLEDMMKPMFEKGLKNLNKVTVNKMKVYSINVDGITQHGGGFYMYTTTATRIGQVSEKMSPMISEVQNYMDNNNIERIGQAFVLYDEWNESNGTAIFSAGFFTPSQVITPMDSNVLNGFLPNQKVVKLTLKGSYENLKEAWETAYNYISENNLEVADNSKAFETYIVNAQDSVNPADWITHIYIPVK